MAFALRTGKRSLARLLLFGVALCVELLSGHSRAAAAQASAFAPPPPIPLDAQPAPELAPLEYPRRPCELAPEFAFALPSSGFGLTALWRPTPFIALGGNATRLSFKTDARSAFYGVLGRVYFDDHGTVEPYLELGLGSGATRAVLGPAARAGGGVEFFLGRHVRLGPAFDWTVIRSRAGFAAFSLRLSLLFGPGA